MCCQVRHVEMHSHLKERVVNHHKFASGILFVFMFWFDVIMVSKQNVVHYDRFASGMLFLFSHFDFD